jgi:hypothetical protein
MMTKTEIKKARKAVKETRKKWRGVVCFVDGDASDADGNTINSRSTCPLCIEYMLNYDCRKCLVYLAGYRGTFIGDRISCKGVLSAMSSQRRTRPIWRALDRIDRYLDKQEAKLGRSK